MKKRIKYILFTFIFMFIGILNVQAASSSVSIWSSADNVKPGDTVRISFKLTEVGGTFNVTSSNSSVLSGGVSNEWYDTIGTSNTFTVSFTAKSAGTATITITPVDATDGDEQAFKKTASVSVKVISEETKNYNYSNNNSNKNSSNNKTNNNNNKKDLSSVNTLSSLSVEGFKLDKEFNKDTLEYSVEVPNDVTKVNIKASATDENASISGAGEQEVSEGNNKLEIKVTAENGDVKTYIVNVNVKELNPINVKANNKEYTIVRKEEGLEIPEGFEKTTVKIDDQDVLAFKNEKLGYTLVALKDKEDNIKYFIYDNGKYQEFIVLEAKGFKIVVLDFPKNKMIKDYKEFEFEANELKYKGYALNKKSKFYLVYGKNYETGKESIYQYDSEEGTLQRYNKDYISLDNSTTNSFKTPFIIATIIASLLAIAYIVTIIVIKKKNSKPKLKYNKNNNGINF